MTDNALRDTAADAVDIIISATDTRLSDHAPGGWREMWTDPRSREVEEMET